MKKALCFTLLILGGPASVSWAAPVTLNGSYFIGGGASVLDGAGNLFSDNFTDTSPPSTLPLFGTTSVTSPLNSSAISFAIADQGILVAASDTVGLGEFATAATTTNFSGSFITPGGKTQLRLDFANDAFAGNADSITQALLSFSLAGDGNILFNEDLLFSGTDDQEQVFLRTFDLPAGLLGTFDITLSSLSSDFNSAANNTTSVGFRIDAVPEPATLPILLSGLGLLAFANRKKVGAR